jgi:hypothetical protein
MSLVIGVVTFVVVYAAWFMLVRSWVLMLIRRRIAGEYRSPVSLYRREQRPIMTPFDNTPIHWYS